MAIDPGRLANEIADKEAQIAESNDQKFIAATSNEIHGLQVALQGEVAADLGEDFDPG